MILMVKFRLGYLFSCLLKHCRIWTVSCLVSFPAPPTKNRERSGQTCIGVVSPAHDFLCTNQVRVFQSHDIKNVINSHSTLLCNLKSCNCGGNVAKTNAHEDKPTSTWIGDGKRRHWVWLSRLNFTSPLPQVGDPGRPVRFCIVFF